MPHIGDELHHSGWNICSSCHNKQQKRDTLILPCLMSDRVYFIDTSSERTPSIKKVGLCFIFLYKYTSINNRKFYTY